MEVTEGLPSLVTEREAAKFLSISQRTVFNLRKAGKLAFLKIGKVVRYQVSELKRFVEDSSAVSNKEAR